MFDVPVSLLPVSLLPDPLAPAGLPMAMAARLCAPIPVRSGDEAECVGLRPVRHLGRLRTGALHLVLHRDAGGACWTHAYHVLPERGGGVLVLLVRARAGDHRAAFRDGSPHPPSEPCPGLRG